MREQTGVAVLSAAAASGAAAAAHSPSFGATAGIAASEAVAPWAHAAALGDFLLLAQLEVRPRARKHARARHAHPPAVTRAREKHVAVRALGRRISLFCARFVNLSFLPANPTKPGDDIGTAAGDDAGRGRPLGGPLRRT